MKRLFTAAVFVLAAITVRLVLPGTGQASSGLLKTRGYFLLAAADFATAARH